MATAKSSKVYTLGITCFRLLNLRNVKRFRGGLVCKAHRLVYHSTLGWRVIKKKTEVVERVHLGHHLVEGLGFRLQGFGSKVQGFGFRVMGLISNPKS